MRLGPEQTLINFGADTDKGTDQGEQKLCFSDISINFSAHKAYYWLTNENIGAWYVWVSTIWC